MLVLKELYLDNIEKTIINTTILAMAGSGYTSPGECHTLYCGLLWWCVGHPCDWL